MEAPDFNYDDTATRAHATPASNADAAPSRPIESASASTASQTNDSKFAYLLTAGVLGVCTLLAIAITLLLFGILTAGVAGRSDYRSHYGYQGEGFDYEWDPEGAWLLEDEWLRGTSDHPDVIGL